MSKMHSITTLALAVLAASGLSAPARAERAPDPPISLRGLGTLPSVDGTAELRLGMPLEEVVTSFALNLDDPLNEDDPSCRTTTYDYPPLAVHILSINGKVSSLSFEAEFGNIPETSYITPEGIRLGSSLSELIAAYPSGKRQTGYDEAREFIVWAKPNVSGWLFKLSRDDRVTGIAVGDESIEFYEGCA